MKKEKPTIDVLDPHGLTDHRALREMGSARIRMLLDKTYEMRKDNPKTRLSPSSSNVAYVWNDHIDEWISVAEDELKRRENRESWLELDQS